MVPLRKNVLKYGTPKPGLYLEWLRGTVCYNCKGTTREQCFQNIRTQYYQSRILTVELVSHKSYIGHYILNHTALPH